MTKTGLDQFLTNVIKNDQIDKDATILMMLGLVNIDPTKIRTHVHARTKRTKRTTPHPSRLAAKPLSFPNYELR